MSLIIDGFLLMVGAVIAYCVMWVLTMILIMWTSK